MEWHNSKCQIIWGSQKWMWMQWLLMSKGQVLPIWQSFAHYRMHCWLSFETTKQNEKFVSIRFICLLVFNLRTFDMNLIYCINWGADKGSKQLRKGHLLGSTCSLHHYNKKVSRKIIDERQKKYITLPSSENLLRGQHDLNISEIGMIESIYLDISLKMGFCEEQHDDECRVYTFHLTYISKLIFRIRLDLALFIQPTAYQSLKRPEAVNTGIVVLIRSSSPLLRVIIGRTRKPMSVYLFKAFKDSSHLLQKERQDQMLSAYVSSGSFSIWANL